MRHVVDSIMEPALWFAADWSLRWAALIAAAALLLWILRPRRAAIRQLVLLAALIAGLLVPMAPRWGDGWERALQQPGPSAVSPSFPRSAWEHTPGRSAARPTPEPDATQSVADVRSHAPRGNEEEPPSEPLGPRRLILLCLGSCWSLAVTYQLIRCFCGWIFLRRLRRESVEATGATADLFTTCREQLRVGSGAQLAIHPHVRSPILFGWLRPLILVPSEWPQRCIESQRAGLLHELAHVCRRDHLLAPLLEMVRIALFFHPLVRWLLARLEHERELLCDEVVVRLGIDRRDYARLLLESARSSGRLAWPATSLPMSRRRTVKGRIHHLLEEDMERWIRPLPARWAIVLGGGLLVLSLGLASYRVWAEEKAKAETPLAKPETESASDKQTMPIKREDLRYGGKDFNEWRRDILTELKGSIRVDGLRAFAAFGANGYGPEATQAILEIMRGYDPTQGSISDDDASVMRAGAQAVGKIGAAALPGLVQAVEGKNRNARLFAIKALESMRSNARSAVPVLLKAMRSDDPATRAFASEAVYCIDSHAKGFVPALIEALKDEDVPLRRGAAERLGDSVIVADAKPAIPALLEALRGMDANVRWGAIQTLNSIGPEKQGVETVSRFLRDKNHNMRREAYKFLQSLGPDAKGAVPALIAVLKAPLDSFTQMAVFTLAGIGPDAKGAVPELTKLLRRDVNGPLRQSAMDALKQISPDDER